MKNNKLIVLGLVLMMGVSCSSPNKEKTTESKTEEKSAPVTAPPTAAPAAKEALPGEKLFVDKGCTTCHKPDTKLVGPALKDIAAAYKGDKEALKSFLKEEKKPIVDPGQASVMHPQIAVTKALPADQLDQIADYILSNK